MTKLLVIDTETGGLDPLENSILSLGAVVWDDGQLGRTFEVYICEPEIKVEANAMRVNRIDLAWLKKNGNSPRDAVSLFNEFISANIDLGSAEKVTFAGHNIGFDIGFIRRLYRLASIDYEQFISHRSLDTASVLKYLALAELIPASVYSSSSAFEYFNIHVDDQRRHTAMGDAVATGHLLSKLVEIIRR